MSDDSAPPWEKVLDAHTTRDELEQIITEQTRRVLVDAVRQIAALGLSPGDQLAALAQIASIVSGQARTTFETAWRDVQVDAATSGIH